MIYSRAYNDLQKQGTTTNSIFSNTFLQSYVFQGQLTTNISKITGKYVTIVRFFSFLGLFSGVTVSYPKGSYVEHTNSITTQRLVINVYE